MLSFGLCAIDSVWRVKQCTACLQVRLSPCNVSAISSSTGATNCQLVCSVSSNVLACLQVPLSPCNVSAISSSTGAANCQLVVPSNLFPAAGATAATANLAVVAQVSGSTVATSASAVLTLQGLPSYPTTTAVTMVVTVPNRNLHAGERLISYDSRH